MENHLVVFHLASEHYAIDIAAVEGIIKLQTITTVPHAPHFVEGVTNLRGKVLPVIDLRKRFGFTAGEPTNDTRIVVVEMNGATVGIVVDGVSAVLRISPELIEPPSPIVTTVESSFIKGIAKLADRLVILLDIGQVLSQTEQAALRAVPVAG
jgi:purine-binding chemotaxis protein CheW